MSDLNVEFVRAGAGSGKTYFLTRSLAEALSAGTARGSGIVATTFTVKAATELRERSREWLLQEGRLDLLTQVGQARIGTVHSVCGQWIQRFCFELGLSPQQKVLPESQVKALIRATLDSVLEGEESARLLALAERLGLDQEKVVEAIQDVLDAARQNGIAVADLPPMGARNADAMLAHWPPPVGFGDPTADLLQAVTAAESALGTRMEAARAGSGRVTKVAQEGLAALGEARRALGAGSAPWALWEKLRKLGAGAPNADLLDAVHEKAAAHFGHPAFHADVRGYLQAVFDLAARVLGGFQRAKQEMGAVDFTDQEILLLQAIRTSSLVREALAAELDLVLVDEFQDTSPLQLAIFVELARLARRSIWVGDPKQAIYGFRGTDAELIGQVVDSITRWGGRVGAPLTASYRSTPELVDLVNAVFVPAFQPQPANQVALGATRKSLGPQPALLNWRFAKDGKSKTLNGLGPALTALLAAGHQVEDRRQGQLRPVQAEDIAVLCRTNDDVREVVGVLEQWGIPTAAARPGLLQTPEAQLVLACLRRLHDPADTVASALVLSLAESLAPPDWLARRLDFLAGGGLPAAWLTADEAPHPLLARLEVLRPRLALLTPLDALHLARAESGAAQLVHRWSGDAREAGVRLANIEALLAMGAAYEDECQSLRSPATVDGLLLWLQAQSEAGEDLCAAAARGAVEVMTYHKAKGLEWPVVVLTGLGKGHRSNLWGVRARTEGAFDPAAPLRDRVIHHWVYPYGRHGLPQAALDAEASTLGRAMRAEALRESIRLLYVATTRPRDTLVLVGHVASEAAAAGQDWLAETGPGADLLWGDTAQMPLTGERGLNRVSQFWDAASWAATPARTSQRDVRFFRPGERTGRLPLWCAPSTLQARTAFKVQEVEALGQRLALPAGADMADVGVALHACFAYAVADPTRPVSADEIAAILKPWRQASALDPSAVARQVQALLAWVQRRWPGAQPEAEVPVQARTMQGQVLNGQIDLLLTTPQGHVIIDHKADPRRLDGDRLAQAHGAQLSAYAQAVAAATGRPVIGLWLFLPTVGKAVEVVEAAAASS